MLLAAASFVRPRTPKPFQRRAAAAG